MAHPEQIEFCKKVSKLFPDFFKHKLVLDIGSLDVNGNNRYLFENCTYLGVDVADGNNVDIVSLGGQLQLPDASIDTIISTECFEHDMHYQETLLNIYRMLKPGGLLLFTCATEGRPEHGTERVSPEAAPLLQQDEEWKNYYKNLTEDDIRKVLHIENLFKTSVFEVNCESHDLYFYGIKSGEFKQRINKYYSEDIVNRVEKEKNAVIRYKDKLLLEKDVLLKEQGRMLFEKDRLLVERDAVISGLFNSKSWRYTKAIRKFMISCRHLISLSNNTQKV